MAVTVRELITKLGFKTDKKDVRKADKIFATLKKAATVLAGAFVTGKVVQGIRNIVNETAALGDSIDKVSQKLGVNAQALQELRFAAEQTGVAQQTFDLALQRFTRRAAEAARGTGEARDALSQMGVQLLDSRGQLRPVEDLLGDVADAMQRTESDGERLRLAFKLFDSEGAALVTTLKGGRSALEGLRAKARETGGILDTRLIKLSARLVDTQGELNLTFQGLRNILAKELIPRLISAARGIIAWVKANRQLIRQKIVETVRRLANFAARLGRFFADAADRISRWVDELTPAEAGFLKILAIVTAIALLLTLPGGLILAIGAAVLLVVDDFQTWREGGVSVIGALIDVFIRFLDQWPILKLAVETTAIVFQGFFDSVATGVRVITGLISTFANFFIQIFQGKFQLAFINAFANIKAVGKEVLDFLRRSLERIGGVAIKIGEFFGLGAEEEEEDVTEAPLVFESARKVARGEAGGGGLLSTFPRQIPGGGTNVFNQNRVRVENTIVAPPGADEEKLATMVEDKTREVMEEELRFSMEDVAIAGAGG